MNAELALQRLSSAFFPQRHVRQYNGLFPLKKLKKAFVIVAEICCRPPRVCKQCREVSPIANKSKTFLKETSLGVLDILDFAPIICCMRTPQ